MLQRPVETAATSGHSRLAILTARPHTLLGQRHLELDGRQLLGGLADALQKRQPARGILDVGKQRFTQDIRQPRIFIVYRFA